MNNQMIVVVLRLKFCLCGDLYIRSIDLIEVEGQFVEYYNAYMYNVIAP